MPGDFSETQELARVRKKSDRQALLAQLFSAHRGRLRRMVEVRLDPRLKPRVDPSDVLQDVFLKASKRLEEYLRSPPAPLFLWLRRLAAQELRDVHRHHLGTKARDARREVSMDRQADPGVSSVLLAGQLNFAVGDLNADGAPELLALDGFSDSVNLRLNLGDGTFGDKIILPAPPIHDFSIPALGDLDGDLDLDLAVPTFSGPGMCPMALGFNNTPPPHSQDCNRNGLPDECELAEHDCNQNGTPDDCDIAAGGSLDEDSDGIPDECAPSGPLFLRGDCNSDGEVRGLVTDAVFLLNFNFVGGPRPGCLAACDTNGDGAVVGVVTDAVYLLTYNFLGGPPPVAPFPDCGPSEREGDEALGCATPPAARGLRRGVTPAG